MKVKVLYFGSLSEKTGVQSEWIENVSDLGELKSQLGKRFPFLIQLNCTWAVNLDIKKENISLNENDEIAVMPPFAGG